MRTRDGLHTEILFCFVYIVYQHGAPRLVRLGHTVGMYARLLRPSATAMRRLSTAATKSVRSCASNP